MHYVYLLRSLSNKHKKNIGLTSDIKKRFKEHNRGDSAHTTKYGPWELITYMAFSNDRQAREFEYYLKSGSGRAFANRRLWG